MEAREEAEDRPPSIHCNKKSFKDKISQWLDSMPALISALALFFCAGVCVGVYVGVYVKGERPKKEPVEKQENKQGKPGFTPRGMASELKDCPGLSPVQLYIKK